MTTSWTSTATAATAAGTATLTELRARVLTQITGTDQGIDWTPVATSSGTLTTLRDRIELILQDSGNAIWATGDLDEALTHALEQYSRYRPNHAIHDLTLSADGREVDISGITGLIRVERVWWDYDSSDPSHPPNWRHFEVWPGSILFINDPTAPSSGDHVRVWHTKEHTINGLASATATTIPVDDESFLLNGAAAFAARFRAIEIAEDANVDQDVFERLMEWARKAMSEFTEGLRRRYKRGHVFDFDQDDLDEAIRWALHRYNEIHPDRAETSVTLSSSGREVDISSITDYHEVLRVWWDYDSSSPAYPPNWRDFELWDGDILFIDDPDEPQSGDVVRVWYTRLHTINGLDGSGTTTLPSRDDNLIVAGAVGFACQERIQDEEDRWIPRKLGELSSKRLAEFERGLKRLQRHHAIRRSGVAQQGSLDRWEDGGDGWA